jgi:hypothetical protein
MRGTNVGRPNTCPLRSEPVLGQRFEDSKKRFASIGSKDSCDVLQQKPVGSSVPSNSAYVLNEPSFIVYPFTFPSSRHGLTREPCGHHVHPWRVGDLGQVTQVRHVGMVVSHDLCGVLVDLGVVGELNI